MNFNLKLMGLNSRFSAKNSGLRWAILTVGAVVNGAILFSAPSAQVDSANVASAAYQPPSIQAHRHAVGVQASVTSTSPVQSQFALADALAQAGDREAATEQYLQAMTSSVESH